MGWERETKSVEGGGVRRICAAIEGKAFGEILGSFFLLDSFRSLFRKEGSTAREMGRRLVEW